MPRKLSSSANAKRATKARRKVEEAKDLPEDIKHSMIEGLYRIGWSAQKIVSDIGLPRRTVFDNIKRFEERRTCRRLNDESVRMKVIEWARKYGSREVQRREAGGEEMDEGELEVVIAVG